MAWLGQLGANPVAMDVKELYSALEQHVVDGQENPYVLIDTSKFYEVQKYLTLTKHAYSPLAVLKDIQLDVAAGGALTWLPHTRPTVLNANTKPNHCGLRP